MQPKGAQKLSLPVDSADMRPVAVFRLAYLMGSFFQFLPPNSLYLMS